MNIKDQLLLDIKTTFKTELHTDDIFIESAGHVMDVEIAIKALAHQNWFDVPLSAIIKYRGEISYLNAIGFHFFLPAFMTVIIKYPHDVDTLVESTIFFLTRTSDDGDWLMSRAIQFNKEESLIIAKFLDAYFDLFLPDEWGYSAKDVKNIKNGIDFWSHKAKSS